MPDKIKLILFLCTVNRYRSPFAAAPFQKQIKDDKDPKEWHIGSGTNTGGRANHHT